MRELTAEPIPEFSFADLVETDDLQELISLLSELTDVAIGIFDSEQNFFAKAGFQPICSSFHRAHAATCMNCVESDQFIEKHLNTRTPVTYRCKNGMWDIGYPVFIGNKHLANIMCGQFFFDDEEINVAFFERQALKYGFDTASYLSALKKVPKISRKKGRNPEAFYVYPCSHADKCRIRSSASQEGKDR